MEKKHIFLLFALALIPGLALAAGGLTTIVEIAPWGDDEYRITFLNENGEEYEVPLASNEGGIWKLGDDGDDLHYVEGSSTERGRSFPIGDDDYFLIESEGVTQVFRYEDYDSEERVAEFEDVASGSVLLVQIGTNGQGTLVINGVSHSVIVSDINAVSPGLLIDQDGNGAFGDTLDIHTEENVRVTLDFEDSALLMQAYSSDSVLPVVWKIFPAPANEISMELVSAPSSTGIIAEFIKGAPPYLTLSIE